MDTIAIEQRWQYSKVTNQTNIRFIQNRSNILKGFMEYI